MRVHGSDHLRNVVLVGHGQSGKTSLAEAMLYAAKVTERLGSVDAGNTASDADPEEVARQISISLALLPFEWGEHKINLLGTRISPGRWGAGCGWRTGWWWWWTRRAG